MGKLVDALRERFQTRDIPKTPRGQFNALMRAEKGNTAKVAERLGLSRSWVQRTAKNRGRNLSRSKPETLESLRTQASRDHQPRLTARAEQRAQEEGLTIETRATFGFKAGGRSTDQARVRRLTEDVPDHLVPAVFEALRSGDEDALSKLLGQGLAEEYFRTPGTDAEDLDVEFGDIDYVEVDFR